jgi:hypothetical protein
MLLLVAGPPTRSAILAEPFPGGTTVPLREVERRMAGFAVRCPKCGSGRVEFRRDGQNRWGGWQRVGAPVLHCATCGKDLYGQAAEDEVARQHAAWAAEVARAEAEARKPAPLPPGKCAWQECDRPHGDWSKYCSVNCRNKAARRPHDVKRGRVRLPEAAAK